MTQPLYFSQDGSYGDATDIAIIDMATLADGHLTDMIECVNDFDRPDFARWFVANDHEQDGDEYDCAVCQEQIDNP